MLDGEDEGGGLRRGREMGWWWAMCGLIIKAKNEETDESLALDEKLSMPPSSISLATYIG